MKKQVFIAVLVAIGMTAVCQDKDIRATKLLDEVSAKTKSYTSIKADFSYTMENKQASINEKKTGTLLISGDKYRLTAVGQVVICDGKIIWTYIKESNEVQVNNLEEKDESLTPSKLLTSYNENYKSRIIRNKNTTDPNLESVELIPNDIKNFTKAILVIDKTRKQVKSFILYDKSGNTFTYDVTKFQTDVPVTEANFKFDASKFPGVEVIDMR
jgi:outer membrane lipoprotein-sorting protein